MRRLIPALPRSEERAIRVYHTDTEYVAEEAEDRPQPPSASREEVNREIDFALMTSVMVGVPG